MPKVKQALNLQQGQRLQLSAQLQHSIRLLQLSREELAHEINSVLESNPLLEEIELDTPPEMTSENDLGNISVPLVKSSQSNETHHADDDWHDSSLADRRWEQTGFSRSERDEHGDTYDDHESRWENPQKTLAELLLEALALHRLSEKDQRIAQTLIGCLDLKGYLTASYDEVRQILAPQMAASQFEPIKWHVRTLLKDLDTAVKLSREQGGASSWRD